MVEYKILITYIWWITTVNKRSTLNKEKVDIGPLCCSDSNINTNMVYRGHFGRLFFKEKRSNN